ATRPDRDNKLGRIWRVQHKELRQLPSWRLDPSEPESLVKMLGHPNGWVRGSAQRLLSEGPGAKVLASLARTARSGPTSFARINSLWTLSNLDNLDDRLLLDLMKEAAPIVCKNALQVFS